MIQSLFICGILIGVLLVPARCDVVSVCEEEDGDLRVDCRIEPKPHQFNSYEFSMSTGPKETVINTNVSGSAAEPQFKDHSYVEELEPHGYRLILSGFTHKLTHNNTFMCKMWRNVASVHIEKDQLLPCSAVSVFVQSCSWMLCLLLSVTNTSWV